MNPIVKIIESAVLRRIAYAVAPFVIGMASQSWWFQDLMQSYGFTLDNLDALTGQIVLVLSAALALCCEGVAWMRRRQQSGQKTDLQAIIDAAASEGLLHKLVEKASPSLENAGRQIIADWEMRVAKEAALKEAEKCDPALRKAGRIASIIPVLLIASNTLAQDAVEPKVSVDTNTIATIVANWKNIETPGAFFGAVKDNLEIGGCFMVGYGPANGLQSGYGAYGDLTVWRVDLEAAYINLGPGYALGTTHDSQMIHGIEAGANVHFVNLKIEEKWKALPLIGAIPIAWDKTSMHIGLGATIIGPTSWQPIGILATVGFATGWGK